MARDKLDTTPLIDLAAVLVSPALVMAMLGSLVVFVIDVVYRGQFPGRLVYTFAFYVFGAVLIARIAIKEGRGKSRIYAAALGGACFLAMLRFVEYPTGPMQLLGPALNVVLMVLVFLAADKLTWDCTHFDDARKASGRGVLAAAGFDRGSPDADEDDDPDALRDKSWLERWEAYRAKQKAKPHTPGVWVVYFALAALPLFALGQSLIPADDAGRRRAAFLEMTVYIGSALGLLVTTSLMGLRRYLEERGARVPASLTLGWLGLGGALIVVFLAVGAVLPRPHSETPLVDLGLGKKSDREASRYAAVRDGNAGKGDGAQGQKQEAGDSQTQGKTGDPKGGSGGEKGSGGKGGKQGQGKGGDQQGNDSKGGNQKSSDEKSGGEQQGGEKSDDSQSGTPPKEGGAKSDAKSKAGGPQKVKGGDKSGSGGDKQAEKQGGDTEQAGGDKSDPSSAAARLGQAIESIAGFLRYVTWVIVAAVVIVGLVYFCLRGIAPFTNWARDLLAWLRGLFGRAPRPDAVTAAEPDAPPVRELPPFSAFSDPFADGSADRQSVAELAGYTFTALEAWALDRGIPRPPGETPREFAARVGHTFEAVDEAAFAAAELLVRTLYGRAAVPRAEAAKLADLWRAMG